MNNVRYRVVRRGTSLVLAATLATGMVPAIALAQDGGDGDAPVAVQADNGFTPVEGNTYTVPVKIFKASTDDGSVAASYFDDNVRATYENGKYTVALTVKANGADIVTEMTCAGSALDSTSNEDGSRTYTFAIDALDQRVNVGVKLHVVMGPGQAMDMNQSMASPAHN